LVWAETPDRYAKWREKMIPIEKIFLIKGPPQIACLPCTILGSRSMAGKEHIAIKDIGHNLTMGHEILRIDCISYAILKLYNSSTYKAFFNQIKIYLFKN
jgi:hypothetical protein